MADQKPTATPAQPETYSDRIKQLEEKLSQTEAMLAEREDQMTKFAPKEREKAEVSTKDRAEKFKERLKEVLQKESPEKATPEEGSAPKKKPTPPPPPAKGKDAELIADLEKLMGLDRPQQVNALVLLTFKRGINYSAAIAFKLKDPYLLDSFHDALVDELHDYLVQKGKIKKDEAEEWFQSASCR